MPSRTWCDHRPFPPGPSCGGHSSSRTLLAPCANKVIPGLADQHELRAAHNPDTRLGLVDVADIGALAAEAFQKSSEFHSKAISLAGESLTLAQIAERLSVEPKYLCEADVEELRPQQWASVDSFQWQREHG